VRSVRVQCWAELVRSQVVIWRSVPAAGEVPGTVRQRVEAVFLRVPLASRVHCWSVPLSQV
jgi:hypothetical protein